MVGNPGAAVNGDPTSSDMGSERYKSRSVGDVVSSVKSNTICIGDIGAYERNLFG